jgi:hypothetical protein
VSPPAEIGSSASHKSRLSDAPDRSRRVGRLKREIVKDPRRTHMNLMGCVETTYERRTDSARRARARRSMDSRERHVIDVNPDAASIWRADGLSPAIGPAPRGVPIFLTTPLREGRDEI